jgi:hypothetical protein
MNRRSFFRGLIAATALAASATLGLKVTAKAMTEKTALWCIMPNPAYESAMYETWYTGGGNSTRGRWHYLMAEGAAPDYPQRWNYDGKVWTEVHPFRVEEVNPDELRREAGGS